MLKTSKDPMAVYGAVSTLGLEGVEDGHPRGDYRLWSDDELARLLAALEEMRNGRPWKKIPTTVWIALSFMFERSIEAIQHKVMRSQSQSQRTHVMLLRHGNDSARKEVVEDYRKNHLPNHEINGLLARAKALLVKL